MDDSKYLKLFLETRVKDNGYNNKYSRLGDKPLGRGGHGIVHKAEESGRKVALKEICMQYPPTEDGKRLSQQTTKRTKRFIVAIREAIVQTEFDHENIVKCYESWLEPPKGQEAVHAQHVLDIMDYMESLEADPSKPLTSTVRQAFEKLKGMTLYLALELCNHDLAQFIRDHGKYNVQEVMDILYSVCQALAHIHKKNYIHMDIKPDNILRADSKTALGDFGIAKKVNDSVSLNVTMDKDKRPGTFPYNQAPDETFSSKFDMWSLGLVALQLVTGDDSIDVKYMNYEPIDVSQEWGAPIKDFISRCHTSDATARLSAEDGLLMLEESVLPISVMDADTGRHLRYGLSNS